MPDLTVSGNEITDALRALGVQGDGLEDDSSFGVWEATTNLAPNGGGETNATGWVSVASATLARTTDQAKFGAASIRHTAAAVTSQCTTRNADGTHIAVVVGTTYTFSVWALRGTGTLRRQLFLQFFDAGGAEIVAGRVTGAVVTLTDGVWERLTITGVAPALAVTGRGLMELDTATVGDIGYWDGAQFEAQPIATPYIETDGATASRTAALIQAPASLIDETQMWIAIRCRIYSLGETRYAFGWWGDASNHIYLRFSAVTQQWHVLRASGGLTGAVVKSTSPALSAGDEVTVVAALTATEVKLSVNGSAFTTTSSSLVPTLATTQFEIGALNGGIQLDGDILWFATGTGTLTDADAAALHAFGNTDKAPEDFLAVAPACACTATWAADTAAYLDEAFTIIDPDATGASRGILPHLRVDIDFTNDPTNPTRVWTDVTEDVRELSYQRSGRNHELQRTDAGTLAATLDNRAGDYDPTNTSGAHYPGVKRRRWIRVRARDGVTDYTRWTGLIESWRQQWPHAGHDAIVQLEATDALKVLNLFDLDGQSYSSETTDTRVGNVLGAAGIDDYTVDTDAASTVVASGTIASGTNALSHLLQIEETENGLLFAEGDGEIVFQGRHYRLLNSATNQGTIGEADGEIPYRTAGLDLDDGDLWNSVSVTPDGGTAQTAEDAASLASHYESRLNRTILSSSTTEAQAAAEYLVSRYADSSPRIPAVTLIGAADPDLWATILGLGNSDRLVWKRATDAHTIELDTFVERVADRVVPGTAWDVTLQLSPADDQAGWVAGDAVYSLAGQSTIAVY